MGLRNRTQQPFWRTTPTKTSNPDALYQYGIEAVGKRDGKAMIATGWALCQVASLHEHQASDFLTDGYRIWRESPSFDRSQAVAFLTDLFGALSSLTPPEVPSDIWSAAPESVMPASIYFGLRCWAGNELLEVTTDPATRAQYEPLVYRSAADAPHDFVPTRSIEFAKSYAAANGLPEPWVIVLPSPRDHVLAGAGAAGATSGAAANGASSAGTSANGTSAGPGGSAPTAYPEEPRQTEEADKSHDTAAQAPEAPEVSEDAPVVEAPQVAEAPQAPETAPAPAEASNDDSDQHWHPDAPAHVEESVRLVPASASSSTAEYSRPAAQQPIEPRNPEQPARPRPRPTPSAGERPRPTPTPAAPAPTPAPSAPPAPTPAPTASETTTVLSPVMAPPAGAPTSAPPPPAATGPAPSEHGASSPEPPANASAANAANVPPRLADLRRRLREWLESSYHGVEVEDNDWITVPDIGPSTVQVEASLVQGGHLKVEVFTPVLIDAPLTPELLRYVAVEGGRFHFGSMTLDVDEDEHALLQFSHSLIADTLDRDAFLAVVWLVASTVVERSPDLQRRFGGALFRELTSA